MESSPSGDIETEHKRAGIEPMPIRLPLLVAPSRNPKPFDSKLSKNSRPGPGSSGLGTGRLIHDNGLHI
jgi:hypothetical protein